MAYLAHFLSELSGLFNESHLVRELFSHHTPEVINNARPIVAREDYYAKVVQPIDPLENYTESKYLNVRTLTIKSNYELIQKFPRLSELVISDIADVSDECIQYINQLEELTTLEINGYMNGPFDLNKLSGLRNLHTLEIKNQYNKFRFVVIGSDIIFRLMEFVLVGVELKIPGEIIREPKQIKIFDTYCSTFNFDFFENMYHLEELKMRGYIISSVDFLRQLGQLKFLSLSEISDPADTFGSSLLETLQALNNLETLVLIKINCTFPNEIIKMRNLKCLTIYETRYRESILIWSDKITKLNVDHNYRLSKFIELKLLVPEQFEDLSIVYMPFDMLSGYIKHCINLRELRLTHTYVKNLDRASNLTKLRVLYLNEPKIEQYKPLKHLVNLESLSVARCKNLTSIDWISKLTKLKQFDGSDNKIHDLSPLANLTNLEYLVLSSNEITDVSPLEKLQNLIVLDIPHNKIKYGSVEKLKNLQELSMSTGFSGIFRMKSLRKVKLPNPYSKNIDKILVSLCKIPGISIELF